MTKARDISGAANAWTSYTPTLTNITAGTGSILQAAYTLIGKTLFVRIKFTFGTGGAVTGLPTFGLPASLGPKSGADSFFVSSGEIFDASGNIRTISPIMNVYGGLSVGVFDMATANGQLLGASATYPWTWAVNDFIFINAHFEVA